MVNGRNMPSMPMDSVNDTQFISVKFLLRNSTNGIRGSPLWRSFSSSTNTNRSTTPTAMISGMDRKPVIVPQP